MYGFSPWICCLHDYKLGLPYGHHNGLGLCVSAILPSITVGHEVKWIFFYIVHWDSMINKKDYFCEQEEDIYNFNLFDQSMPLFYDITAY